MTGILPETMLLKILRIKHIMKIKVYFFWNSMPCIQF